LFVYFQINDLGYPVGQQFFFFKRRVTILFPHIVGHPFFLWCGIWKENNRSIV